MNRLFKFFINSLGPISTVLGILGVTLLDLFNDQTKTWVIFCLTIMLIIFGFIRIYLVSRKAMKKRYPQGFLPIASFVRYSTSDGKSVQYELFRHIQIKSPFMNEFRHNFMWSGSKEPSIQSDMQTVGNVIEITREDGSKRKVVPLIFKDTLLYNSCEVIHLLMNIDDSDGVSKPFISLDINEPIKSIHFRVDLLHAQQNYYGNKAVLTCQSIEKHREEPRRLREVSFDPVSKSYSCLEVNPKAGYSYKLSWEKPNLQ